MVAKSPMGTETKKMRRQLIGARRPPRISPMKEPLNAAAWFTPRAMPRWFSGKASVRMAAELAMSMAAPTPWKMRMMIRYNPAASPVSQHTLRRSEKKVKTAKPRLYMRTRPYMSPSRPSVTTSTLVVTRKPRIIQSR